MPCRVCAMSKWTGVCAAGIDFAKAKKGSGASVAGTDVWSIVDLSSELGQEPHNGQGTPLPAAGANTTVHCGHHSRTNRLRIQDLAAGGATGCISCTHTKSQSSTVRHLWGAGHAGRQ